MIVVPSLTAAFESRFLWPYLLPHWRVGIQHPEMMMSHYGPGPFFSLGTNICIGNLCISCTCHSTYKKIIRRQRDGSLYQVYARALSMCGWKDLSTLSHWDFGFLNMSSFNGDLLSPIRLTHASHVATLCRPPGTWLLWLFLLLPFHFNTSIGRIKCSTWGDHTDSTSSFSREAAPALVHVNGHHLTWSNWWIVVWQLYVRLSRRYFDKGSK